MGVEEVSGVRLSYSRLGGPNGPTLRAQTTRRTGSNSRWECCDVPVEMMLTRGCGTYRDGMYVQTNAEEHTIRIYIPRDSPAAGATWYHHGLTDQEVHKGSSVMVDETLAKQA